jgi:hypothetical protein
MSLKAPDCWGHDGIFGFRHPARGSTRQKVKSPFTLITLAVAVFLCGETISVVKRSLLDLPSVRFHFVGDTDLVLQHFVSLSWFSFHVRLSGSFEWARLIMT